MDDKKIMYGWLRFGALSADSLFLVVVWGKLYPALDEWKMFRQKFKDDLLFYFPIDLLCEFLLKKYLCIMIWYDKTRNMWINRSPLGKLVCQSPMESSSFQ